MRNQRLRQTLAINNIEKFREKVELVRFSQLPRLAVLILFPFSGTALLANVPYVVVMPGSATDVTSKMISLKSSAPSDQEIFRPSGKLNMLSIQVTNPDSYITGAEVLLAWAKGDWVVFPRSVIYQPGKSAKEDLKIAKAEMVDSQLTAKKAALAFLRKNYPGQVSDRLKPSDISISIKDTGGPSAGTIFSLGIIELLTREDLTQGRNIAGTGTIDASGKVGGIGGAREKFMAAKKSGATLFLIPDENCQDLDKKAISGAEGVTVAAISTLSEAVKALNSSSPRGCATLGA